LLAGIELSGIQKYLYNIANRKAARSLKGRSFFLQMQMTVVANRLLAMCNGQQGQLIYASGGKAYLLLPNTEEVQQAIKALRTQLQQELWDDGLADEHLYAGVDAVAFRIVFHNEKGKYELLLPSGAQATWDLGQLWKALGDQLAIQKRRRFDTLLHTRFGELFSPKGTGGYEAVCAVTGRTGKLVKLEDTTDGEPLMVTSTVKKMYELGRQLAKENSLVLKDATDKVLSPDAYILGNDTTSRRPQGHVVLLNNTDLGNLLRSGNKGMGVTYQWYGGNQVPLKPDDSPKTFEELGADNRLAVLRMDVDGLGAIFQSGIPETMRSFTSYATLSSQLDYFFSGYLNHIHQKPAFAQSIQIIYAGGDDVFAVGDWQRLLEFAKAVRDAFRKYVCNREDISISAGFVVVGDKFPISKAAELAGQAEDAAKTHLGANGLPKNAINLLGVNLSWNQEFATVRNLAEWLQAQLESNKLNRSILFKLQQLRLLSKSENPNQRLSWKWQAAYMLGRMDNKEARQPLESLILEHKWEGVRITDDADRLLERIGLACRLAELGTRQNTEHTA
jgi:CRISPR-associated protein Csm1